jgi:hypothetical protein
MDSVKFEQAPTDNPSAERSVGFINYGLQRRSAKQLACASNNRVKAKAADLIEKFPFSKKVSGRITAIINAWDRKQKELIERGMQSKEKEYLISK